MPPKKRFVKAQFSRGIKNRYDTLHGQYTGYHSKVVEVRSKRTMRLERKSQFLTHLATALKEYYSSLPNKSEIEIQIALVGGEYFMISSNKNETATHFYNELVTVSANTVADRLAQYAIGAALKASTSTAQGKHRTQRHTGKVGKELAGKRLAVDISVAVGSLEKEGHAICAQFDVARAIGSDIQKFCTGTLDEKKVALITHTKTEMHAEQKILLALCMADPLLDPSTEVIFAGTFRPCRGCFESLSVVSKYYLSNLKFGVRPGHYWCTTEKAHVAIVKRLLEANKITQRQLEEEFDEKGLVIGLTNTTYRPSLRMREDEQALHYASESDSDDESDV
jgi:hypothetical protein